MQLLSVFPDSMQNLLNAICWTLLHSLWQGLVIAILAGIILLTTKKSRPAARYNLLTGLFSVLLLTNCITFLLYYPGGNSSVQFTSLQLSSGTNSIASGHTNMVSSEASGWARFTTNFTAYFTEHASLVVMVWFIVFAAKLVKILNNLLQIQKLRNQKIHLPSEWWRNRLAALALKLNLHKPIGFFESELASVPMMTGFFKPIILLPFSMLNNLSAEEVEAILLHELAHIRRKDYLVNFFQCLAEVVFFFNPGLLWISSLIREERENCCDDIAISETQSKREFISALVSFEEYKMNGNVLVTGFPGRKNHLLQRVKRIVHNRNKTLDAPDKIFMAICLLALSTVAFAFVNGKTPVKPVPPVGSLYAAEQPALPDTVPANEPAHLDTTEIIDPHTVRIEYDDPIMVYGSDHDKVVMKNGKVVELYIKGKKIPKEKFAEYKLRIAQIIEYQTMKDDVQRELEMRQLQMEKMQLLNEKREAEANTLQKLKEDQIEAREKDEALLHEKKEMEEKLDDLAKEAGNSDDLKRRMMELDLQQQKLSMERAQLELLYQKKNNLNLKNAKIEADKFNDLAKVHQQLEKEQLALLKKAQLESREDSHAKVIDPIVYQLKEAGVLENTNAFSFDLNQKELLVNGKLQSAALHKKLAEQFLGSSSDQIKYKTDGKGSESSTMSIHHD